MKQTQIDLANAIQYQKKAELIYGKIFFPHQYPCGVVHGTLFAVSCHYLLSNCLWKIVEWQRVSVRQP